MSFLNRLFGKKKEESKGAKSTISEEDQKEVQNLLTELDRMVGKVLILEDNKPKIEVATRLIQLANCGASGINLGQIYKERAYGFLNFYKLSEGLEDLRKALDESIKSGDVNLQKKCRDIIREVEADLNK